MLIQYDPSIGESNLNGLDSDDYAANCAMTVENLWGRVDIFLLAHFFGWVAKALLFRSLTGVCAARVVRVLPWRQPTRGAHSVLDLVRDVGGDRGDLCAHAAQLLRVLVGPVHLRHPHLQRPGHIRRLQAVPLSRDEELYVCTGVLGHCLSEQHTAEWFCH